MGGDLTAIAEMAKSGWWVPALGIVAVLVGRAEFWKAILAPRTDRSLDLAMSQMIGLLRENIDHFEAANTGINMLRGELEKQTVQLHRIVEELVRRYR